MSEKKEGTLVESPPPESLAALNKRLGKANFNYAEAGVDREKEVKLRELANEIRGLLKITASQVVQLGRRMAEARKLLPKGQFGPWLDAEFGFKDYRTAEHWMNVAKEFGGEDLNLDKVPVSVLYRFSAPSVPEEAKREARRRIRNGENITHKGAARIIEQAKGQEAPVVENFTTTGSVPVVPDPTQEAPTEGSGPNLKIHTSEQEWAQWKEEMVKVRATRKELNAKVEEVQKVLSSANYVWAAGLAAEDGPQESQWFLDWAEEIQAFTYEMMKVGNAISQAIKERPEDQPEEVKEVVEG